MDRPEFTVYEWLTAAVKGVRFAPDRAAVRQELWEHIEDKTADLMRIFPGMTRKEAEERALSGMGDPEALGVELAKIHTPWLGYLWQFSRVLLAAAACLLAVALVSALRHGMVDGLGNWMEARRETAEAQVIARVLYEDGAPDILTDDWWTGVERLALYDRVSRSVPLGEAEVTLERAALWQMEEGRSLMVQISIDYDRARDAAPWLEWYLQGEDSLGNHYGHELRQKETGGAHMSGFRYFGKETRRDGYTWNFWLDDLPQEAEWVRLTYALRPASEFEFVLDLTGEVAK